MEYDNQQNSEPQVPHQPEPVFNPEAQPINLGSPSGQDTTPMQPSRYQQTIQPNAPATIESSVEAQIFSGNSATPVAPKSKSKIKTLTIAVLALLIIGAGSAFALVGFHEGKKVALNCTPPTVSSLDETTAESVYTSFAEAIKQSNQSCVDRLSSSYFQQLQAQAFPGSNGKWVTMQEGGLPSVASRLSNLPTTLSKSHFTQSSYTEAVMQGSTTTNPPQGITLTYPVSGVNNVPYHLDLSFVLQSGKLVVDNLVLQPASLDTSTASSNN